MRQRLTWLILLTSAAMLGMILIQLFWLRSSYTDRKARFQSAVDIAITETYLQTMVNSILPVEDTALAGPLHDSISSAIGQALSSIGDPSLLRNGRNVTIKITGTDTTDPQTRAALAQLRQQLGGSTSGTADTVGDLQHIEHEFSTLPDSLHVFRRQLEKTLAKKEIHLPFELALVDRSGAILQCTTDSGKFKQIPVKTADSTIWQSSENDRHFQAAFPGVTAYLLRQMVPILSLSGLLMLVVVFSFAAMVKLFYRQKRIADIRNDFMNNMTHELKTPISSVSVALELVQDESVPMSDEQKAGYFQIARNELQRLTILVEKVLKMAAFEKSEIRVAKESFLVRPWLDSVVNALRPIFERSAARVSVEVRPELLLVHADKVHLTNVLQSLLDNAVKYNDKEYPELQITVREEETAVLFQIRDNGKGIPPAYTSRIFDKFFRVPSGDLHDIKGYGLGLSYVKAVTDLHGGTVAVESRVGAGSTFSIRLPKKGDHV